MQKPVCILSALLIFAVLLQVFACAVIQVPPKKEDIAIHIGTSVIPPVIDGTIADGEYAEIVIPDTYLSYICGSQSDWARAKNTVFSAYGTVCGGVFYFALSTEIPEEYYKTEAEPKYMWAQTCLMISYAKNGAAGRNAVEIGIRPDGEYYVWNGIADLSNGFSAVYDGNTVTYEISLPLSAVGAENDDSFRFCFSISSGDYFEDEKQVYVQFGRGISGFSSTDNADAGKDVALFPTVFTREHGDDPSDVQTEKNTDPGTSPDTGIDEASSLTVTAAVLAVASFAAAVFVKRKRI